jgi:hypothetical protein
MPWFLAMQGAGQAGQIYQLADDVDRDRIADEMLSAATLDRVVTIPAVLQEKQRSITLYVRPAAWAAWSIYELTEEERKLMAERANPIANAVANAVRQQQAKNPLQR